MAGGAVTIEELILGLQGSLGSTPEAFHRAAEHLLRIAGRLLPPLALHCQRLKEQPLFIAYTDYVSDIQVSLNAQLVSEWLLCCFVCLSMSASQSACLVAQLSGPCLQAPMCGQLPVLEAIWRSCGSVRCSLIWRQCSSRSGRLSL